MTLKVPLESDKKGSYFDESNMLHQWGQWRMSGKSGRHRATSLLLGKQVKGNGCEEILHLGSRNRCSMDRQLLGRRTE